MRPYPSEYIDDYLAGYGNPSVVLVIGTPNDFKCVLRTVYKFNLNVAYQLHHHHDLS